MIHVGIHDILLLSVYIHVRVHYHHTHARTHTHTHTQVERCRQYGAEIIVYGRDIGEAKERALEIAKERNMIYVNGYNHPHILAGQGTAALEIVGQMERLDVACDAVVIPVGGGGLLAGMAVTLKHFLPDVQVIVSAHDCVLYGVYCMYIHVYTLH